MRLSPTDIQNNSLFRITTATKVVPIFPSLPWLSEYSYTESLQKCRAFNKAIDIDSSGFLHL